MAAAAAAAAAARRAEEPGSMPFKPMLRPIRERLESMVVRSLWLLLVLLLLPALSGEGVG